MTIDQAMGAALKSARGDMTQTELAEKLGEGWSQKRISVIETGDQPVRLEDVKQIARALGKDPVALIKDAFDRERDSISE